jgi:hypothetical protein
MPKVKLDAAFVAAARCEAGKRKTDYYDTAVTGFILEVRASGGKTFALRYDADGRQRQHRLGAVGDVTFDKARKEAIRLRSQVVLGGDPAAVKAEKRAVPTFAELATDVLAHMKTFHRSYDTTEMYMRRHILPRWGKLRLTDIRQPDVARWLAEKSDEGLKPGTVLKIRMLLHRALGLAIAWDTPGITRNPVKGIPHKPLNNARERFLTAEEAERLKRAAAASLNDLLAPLVGLLLLTGCRISELLNAEWRHVDLGRRTLFLPATKTKPRHVPLSQSPSRISCVTT